MILLKALTFDVLVRKRDINATEQHHLCEKVVFFLFGTEYHGANTYFHIYTPGQMSQDKNFWISSIVNINVLSTLGWHHEGVLGEQKNYVAETVTDKYV